MFEGAEAHADAEAGRLGADAGDDLAQEAGAVLEAAAIAPGATPGAEELVAEIAVAVLDIDPGEAGLLRQARRRDEILDEAGDLVVVEEDVVVVDAELRIQQGVAVEGAGLEGRAGVGAAEAARVGELEADAQVGGVAEAFAVGRDEGLAQAGDGGQRGFVEQELVGVGAAIVADGDGLAAPDELGAAEAEALPAAGSQLCGPAVEFAVPALHGQDAPAVADGAEVGVEGLGEGRSGRGQQRIVERQVGADALEVGAELLDAAQARDAGDALGRHGVASGAGGWLSRGEYSVGGCLGECVVSQRLTLHHSDRSTLSEPSAAATVRDHHLSGRD